MQQWRVTWYDADDEPVVEVVRAFADAWAISQPGDDDDDLDWRFTTRQATLDSFNQDGVATVTVAWTTDNAHRVVIERL